MAKAAAKSKPKAKAPAKTAARPATKEVAPSGRRDETMSIRRISNGFIVRESWTQGSGPNAKYMEKETFTKVRPSIVLPK